MSHRNLLSFAILASLPMAMPAFAQSRTDNALETAEDAFGASVGQEEIGIYSSLSVRGFDPTAAGNVRVEGLYVDLPGGLSDHVSQNTLIRVGIANIGTLLAAPSGIVDISLREYAGAWQGRMRASSNDLGFLGIEVDASGPVSDGVGINLGASAWGFGNDYRGVEPRSFSLGAIVSAGDDAHNLKAYASFTRSSRRVEPWFYPVGDTIPQRLPRGRFLGQEWSHYGYDATTIGVVGKWQPGRSISVRAGLAFSESATSDDTFDLVEDWTENGKGQRLIYRVPGQVTRAYAGEAQADWTMLEGQNSSHRLSFGLRGRAAQSTFGGDVLAAQADWAGMNTPIAQPGPFQFGAHDQDDTDQGSIILGWRSESDRLGFISMAIAPTIYRHQVTTSDNSEPVSQTTRDLLYSALAALKINHRITVFAGTSRGIEASGVAPISATNRGEVLPAAITRQYDAGIRLSFGALTGTFAAFNIARPYPTELPDGSYALAGEVRHRGIEASVAGKLTDRLDLLAGFYLIDATLKHEEGSARLRPLAVPAYLFQAGAEFALTERLDADATMTVTGPQWLRADGNLRLPTSTGLDLGLRYGWSTSGGDTMLRLRLSNVLDSYSWRSASDGGISPAEPRRLSISLAKSF